MKDYLDDILVWVIVLAILTPVVIALFRRKRIFIVIMGILIFLGALPTAIMSELSINGCCGAPSTGFEGAGYIIGAVMAIIGILIVIFSKKLVKN